MITPMDAKALMVMGGLALMCAVGVIGIILYLRHLEVYGSWIWLILAGPVVIGLRYLPKLLKRTA